MASSRLNFVLLLGLFNFVGCWSDDVIAQETSKIERQSKMGPVTVTVALSPDAPVIGDVLKLEIEVVADQDVEVLMPEFGEALGRFQISDFVPNEKLNEAGETVFTQSYKLQSPPSGDHAIPPILIEFVDRRDGEQPAPEGQDAYELFTERINFSVESVLVQDAADSLNPPLGRIDPDALRTTGQAPYWIYIVLSIGGLAVVGCFLLAITSYRRRAIRRTAYEIARRQMDRLLSAGSATDNIDQFYVELTTIVRQYLENRFELRAPELTTEEFLLTVSGSAELTSDHKSLLQNFLNHADLVKFAGLQPGQADIDETIAKATRFLEETRENAPLLVDPEAGSDKMPEEASDV